MGFFSGVRRRIKKLIPKEVRPFIPYIAAGFSGPIGAKLGMSALAPMYQKALIAGGTRFLTDDEADLKDVGITSALAAAPSALGEYAKTGNAAALKMGDPGFLTQQAKLGAAKLSGMAADKPFTTLAAQAGIDYGIKAAELNEDALEDYNRMLAEQGIADKAGRRAAIRAIYSNTGTWDMDEVDSMLDTYGYRTGGRVGYEDGGETEKERRRKKFKEGFEYAQEGLESLEDLEDEYKPLPIRELRLARGGITDINMEEQIDTPSGDMMMDENIQVASDPSPMDELDSLSLMLFRKPLSELTDDEYEDLKDFASQQSLKPGLIDEYRNYKYNAEEQGQTPMSPRDYFRMEFGAARLGVKKGGPIELNINVGGNNMEDIKGQTAGPAWYQERIENLEFLFGDELTDEEIADIAYDSDKYYDKVGYEPGMKKGGKVIELMPKGILYKGKAKDYPGIKQLIKDMKKKGTRPKKADGGLMNLGGKEMDLRGGGFVPMGAKERADDVPARLSKNEFVMTADAVRGAGGGSVQKGADLMYDQMKRLEGQA